MAAIPHASGIDNTIPLLREGYTFISSRCDELGTGTVDRAFFLPARPKSGFVMRNVRGTA